MTSDSRIAFSAADSKFADLFQVWRQDPVARKLNLLEAINLEQLKHRLDSSSSDLSEFETLSESSEHHHWSTRRLVSAMNSC